MSLPHVKKPCGRCPFRKDTQKGWLGRERMKELLEADNFVCHKKTDLQCAGHMLLKGMDNQFVRMARIMRIELPLSGRELVFESIGECVDHHTNDRRIPTRNTND